MMRSHLERSTIALTATAVCSLGAVATERQDVSTHDSVVASAAPAPALVALGGYDRINFKIYPVTIDAAGFSPASYPPHMLEQSVRDGWQTIVRAAGGATSTVVTIETEPMQTTALPGVAKQPDLCDNKARNKFVNALIDTTVPDHPKDTATETTVPIVVVEDVAKHRCADGATNANGIVIANGTPADTRIYAHEFGHKLFTFGHDDYIACPGRQHPVVSASCPLYEYGDAQTVMGEASGDDSDPFNAYDLQRMGAIRQEDVATIDSDEPQELTLQSLNSTTPGIKAVRIPIEGIDELPADPNSKQIFTNTAPQLTCTTAIMLELSSGSDGNNQSASQPFSGQPLSVKAYLVNESGKAAGKDTFRIANNMDGDTMVVTAGHKTVRVTVHDQVSKLPLGHGPSANGHADLSIQTVTGAARRADSCDN